MTPLKRVEIVIDAAHTSTLLSTLRENGADAYTVIHDVQGIGDRGDRTGDSISSVFLNTYVLIACEPQLADSLAPVIQKLLQQHGGMCLISDALWLEH